MLSTLLIELRSRARRAGLTKAAWQASRNLLEGTQVRVGAILKRLTTTPHYVFGRFQTVRTSYSGLKRARSLMARTRPLMISEHYKDDYRPIPTRPSGLVQSSVPVREHLVNLKRDAFSAGIELTEQSHRQLVELAHTCPIEENGVPLPSLEDVRQKRGEVAIATVTGISYQPFVQTLLGDAFLLEVAEGYLGYRPRYVSPWLFFSLRNNLTQDEREARYQTVRFHYDVHGLNFLYVNFYLTDTDERSGAHVLIWGSHRDKRLRHLFGSARLSEEQALADYGAERVIIMRGAARSGFFEDTSCYHKALAPLDRERLMLQIRIL